MNCALFYSYGADGADLQNGTAVFAEYRVHFVAVIFNVVVGNVGLHGAAEAAAVYAPGAAAEENTLGKVERKAHGLVFGGVLGIDILQVHIGRTAGVVDDIEEIVEIIFIEGIVKGVYTVIFVEVMEGAQKRSFPYLGL